MTIEFGVPSSSVLDITIKFLTGSLTVKPYKTDVACAAIGQNKHFD